MAESGLSAAQILEAWERGRVRRPALRSLEVLAVAEPDAPVEATAAWPLGRRDAALIALRRRTFGERAEGFVRCPVCEEPLEFELPLGELLGQAPAALPETVEVEGATLRLPSTEDLLAVEGHPQPAEQLLRRLVVEGEPPSAEAAAQALAEADPLAELSLELACVACGHPWTSIFDISSYFCQEIEAEARRVVDEVTRLAQAYGWSEREILSMTPARRRLYLEKAEAS